MFYCCISSNTTTPPTPSGPQSLLSSWEAEEERMQVINWIGKIVIHYILPVGCNHNGRDQMQKHGQLTGRYLIILLADSCVDIFFTFPAVHTSATRSGGKTRLGYHWLGRRASSGGCQMKVLRNRDNQRTHQGKGSGQLDRLSSVHVQHIYIVFCIDHYIYI